MIGGLFASKLLRGQRERDRALRESEEKLSQIIEGNSIAILVIDIDHNITHWNKACEILTGLPAGEMVGTKKEWSAFYPAARPDNPKKGRICFMYLKPSFFLRYQPKSSIIKGKVQTKVLLSKARR